jgi:hypothetical protein
VPRLFFWGGSHSAVLQKFVYVRELCLYNKVYDIQRFVSLELACVYGII